MIRMLFVLTIAALATPATAGELILRGGQGTWTSSECRMPTPTPGPFPDAQSLNAAQSALVQAVDQYNLCLRNEAERDMQRANQTVLDAVSRLQNEAVAMAQNFPRPR